MLVNKGCSIELLPWDTDFTKVEADGWLISNGPGDPRNTEIWLKKVKGFLTEISRFLEFVSASDNISCIQARKIKKMAYGHRGHNQPVFTVPEYKAFMTPKSQLYG
jgi:carbamoylphosphate synthase small subunit